MSNRGIETDRAKIDVIVSLPYPTSMKEVRSFLGHASFYRRFIKDFSRIASPLSTLLQKDVDFIFDHTCKDVFDELKRSLTSTPIIQPLSWEILFELMCDALNFTVGVVLGQKVEKQPHVIVYASRTLDKAQKFDIEIKDRCDAENLVVDHLSRILQPLKDLSIRDTFLDDQLYHIGGHDPWYADLDAHNFCKTCGRCQRTGNISRQNEMLQLPLLFYKWVEAKATRTDDARVVVDFFGVMHNISTPYHPQTNGQAEISNQEIKQILEKTVQPNRKDWSLRLE
ncbi:uncharacterized protein LOC113866898 [Abrus precatorius]|uniref:Uncharacterized protein LOC113866898 n=1 Tax=Abrus precatorius TaxID=3816 RepID=A0A8B8LM69_ABRPR|nr:uncharacterized protein LOC113866898 [Abrus precatorius]